MHPPDHAHYSRRIDVYVLAALATLLISASAPSIVQVRRTPGETQRLAVQERFSRALGEVHRRWVVNGGSGSSVEIDGRRIELSPHGWPRLDPRTPDQRTGRELFELIVSKQGLGADWQVREIESESGWKAQFYLDGPGGGGFSYDPISGRLVETENEPQETGLEHPLR